MHRRVDLRDLGFDELRVAVALGVVLVQDLVGLLAAVLGDEPARTLREESFFRKPWIPFHLEHQERKDLQDEGDLE